jgi:hypothetical protein
MQMIKLRKNQWRFDSNKQLGPSGGFGQVFEGIGEEGQKVAVKRLHISSDRAGHRELSIAEELSRRDLKYVVPIYDSGMDAESQRYFIVMARADRSLQNLLKEGPVAEVEATSILRDIASGLVEISDLVHRDLKPANVLLHEQKWKLADLGIARFIEESTSPNTLKECLSPEYAAPEQWRLETATHATDIYALGCIAFALLMGSPPFTSGDLRERHLHEEPALPVASPKFRQLITLCLRKNPLARPTINSVLNQLQSIRSSDLRPASPLASAGAVVAEQESRAEGEAARRSAENQRRHELALDARTLLDSIVDALFAFVQREALASRRLPDRLGVQLGSGRLLIDIPFPTLGLEIFPNWKKDIISGALITVEQKSQVYPGRSANLWYGILDNSCSCRWWEASYYSLGPTTRIFEPFGIDDQADLRVADLAASNVISHFGLAQEPEPIDGEYLDKFIQRWSTRLAHASRRALQRPSHLPES